LNQKIVKSDSCANCQQELHGENFCPNCGQKNDSRRLTTSHFIQESLSNSLAFDGRFFRTLYNLVRYPGKVPIDFVEGKRTRYMNPVRIYFLASIMLLFFIQFSDREGGIVEVKNNRDSLIEETTAPDTALTQSPASLHDSIVEDSIIQNTALNPELENESFMEKLDTMTNFHHRHQHLTTNEGLSYLGLEHGTWNRFLYTQAAKMDDFDSKEFNKSFLSKLFWILFLFIPVLGLLLWLIYARRPFYYPEHLIFTFYNQAIFFLIFCIAILTTPFIILLFGIYLLFAMRRFYKQAWGKTILKFILLNILLAPSFILFTLLSMLVVFILM
tara:strand:+ start:4710 stop:5696 length:987 start_codon:yes stop_codon:yes gene_type:complete